MNITLIDTPPQAASRQDIVVDGKVIGYLEHQAENIVAVIRVNDTAFTILIGRGETPESAITAAIDNGYTSCDYVGKFLFDLQAKLGVADGQ